MPREGTSPELVSVLNESDVLLDCLPGSLAPKLARWSLEYNIHYANLTEYVKETNDIISMSAEASTGFVLQTGLAPGFINVLANHLTKQFSASYNVNDYQEISMKVGALSQHAAAPHFYSFTWSPIGVATEYIKDADAVVDYKKIKIPALSGTESIIIDGELYEDDFTSGGAADLPEYFDGKVSNLNYKTLRYAGHYGWVKDYLKDKPKNQETINALEKKMLEEIPMVEDDKVIVYASVSGKDQYGDFRKIEKSYTVYPSTIGGITLRAIQTTTAGPLCQMALYLLEKNPKGVILQSDIDTEAFLNGKIVKDIYGGI